MSNQMNIDEFLRSIQKEMPLSDEELDVLLSAEPEHTLPEGVSEKLLEDLARAQRDRLRMNERLAAPETCNSLGEYVTLRRQRDDLDIQEMASRAGIPASSLEQIVRNDAPISQIPISQMESLIRWLGVELEASLELIRKSFALLRPGPSYDAASARFDSRRRDATERERSVAGAIEELLIKSGRHQHDPEIDTYVESLRASIKE